MKPCGDCKACCQGWVAGDAYGIPFHINKPCVFLGNTCTIYSNRPKVCRSYYCAWAQELFPEWMQPNLCKVIITVENWSEGQFLRCTEMGEKMSDAVLLEIISFCRKHNCPYILQYDGHTKIFGPEKFIAEKFHANSCLHPLQK